MEGPPEISAERVRWLLCGGDGAARWDRRVGERGEVLRECSRDRDEELTMGLRMKACPRRVLGC